MEPDRAEAARKGARKGRSAPPWGWTLLVSGMLALLVAGGGTVLSRQRERSPERPPGNRVDDAFRETARRIDALEERWEEDLDAEARRLLGGGLSLPPDGTTIVGVMQRSLLNPGFSDPARQHLANDGEAVRWTPVMERFGRDKPDAWVLPENDILRGSGWLRMPGQPPVWWQGDGRLTALLMVDPTAAARVVEKEIAPLAGALDGEPGRFSWTGPSGGEWLATGDAGQGGKPDEILRHVSLFGDWTLHRHYPARVVTSYRLPVLAGSFAVAALLVAGGCAIASWQRKAARLAEEQVSFVNRVSHELRTPLTNLLLNADLALDGLPVEEGKIRRRLGLIREETSRLSRIVDNVLAFARMERGTNDVRTLPCDAGGVMAEVRDNFAPLFQRKSIVCDYRHDLSGEIAIDRDAVMQILSNLLSNVEKYAGEGARAEVRLTADEAHFIAEVEDDGPGIRAEARKRVFLPFERAGSRADEGASGTGLGLAISRELAERMGGTLDLLSTARGAHFRLVVPLEGTEHGGSPRQILEAV